MADVTVGFVVAALLQCVPSLAAVAERMRDQWAPDDPPNTVLLGALGRALVVNVRTSDEARWGEVSNVIEAALSSGDVALSTAVATGLLEALDGEAIRRDVSSDLRAQLGPAARAYLHDLGVFYGDA